MHKKIRVSMSDLLEVQIHTTRHYERDALDGMVSDLKKHGFDAMAEVSLFKKAAVTTPDIMLVLGYLLGLAVGAYVAGFFQKMGEDTWDHVKEALLELFERRNEVGHPRLLVKIPVSEEDYLLCSIVENDKKEVEKALDSLPQFIEDSEIKIEEVDYFIPLYYYKGKWQIPGRSNDE